MNVVDFRLRRKLSVLGTALVFLINVVVPASAGVFSSWVPSQTRWQWPTESPPALSRVFAPPDQPWLSGHRGVDVMVRPGEKILSAAPGTVVYAGVLVDRPVISIRHENGLRSTYEPVEPTVKVGETVGQGQEIGTVLSGHDGDALHWGAKFSDKYYVDPVALVFGPFTLKPW